MKNTKNIILIIIIILLAIIIAGMYKFNYLSGKDGYDVDGNRIVQLEQKNRELRAKLNRRERKNKNEDFDIANEMQKESGNDTIYEHLETEASVRGDEETMTIRIPKTQWSDSENKDVTYFIEYHVPKNTKVLNSVYKKLFELRSSYGDGVWNGLTFGSVAIQNGTAQVKLSGSWYPTGDMSGYYFSKLINAAAFQYNTVNKVEVFMNNALFDWCVDDESDGESGCSENPQWWSIDRVEFENA